MDRLVNTILLLAPHKQISLCALESGSGLHEDVIRDYMAAAEEAGVVRPAAGTLVFWDIIGDIAMWIELQQVHTLKIKGRIIDYIRRHKTVTKKNLTRLGYNRHTVNNLIKELSSSGALVHQGGGMYVWNQRVPI